MSNEVTAALLGALAGGVASFFVNNFQDWWRVKRATSKLSFEPQGRKGTRVTARVKNDSNYPITGAVGYITLHHDSSDVVSPPMHFSAFISPKHVQKLQEDRLCWSVAGNPASVDIFAGEWQLLDVADFGAAGEWVEIPSELGWASSQTANQSVAGHPISSRIFLRAGRSYRGTVRIVSATTLARAFEIQIDPSDSLQPLKISG